MKPNQRRHARVKPKAMSSRVRVGGVLHLGLAVENLSLGGAFVRCAQSPPLHTHAMLELAVPGVNQALALPGRVAFVVSASEAMSRKVAAGFSIEFVQPLSPHVQKGLERLLRGIDPRALIPMEAEEPEEERTQSVPVYVPRTEQLSTEGAELTALRKRVATQEREIKRLEAENEHLRRQVPRR